MAKRQLGGTKCARLKVGVTGVGLAKGYQEDEQYNMWAQSTTGRYLPQKQKKGRAKLAVNN